MTRREQIFESVRRGMEQIPGYQQQSGIAMTIADELCSTIGVDVGDHCCLCSVRQDAWDRIEGIAGVALGVLAESTSLSTALRDEAEECLLSFFRVNASLGVPNFKE
jgi:hypothetical protein